MRTLAIQVRLRRLLRVASESARRLAAEPSNRELASASVARLLAVCTDVRQAWSLESSGVRAVPDELCTVQKSVARSLSAIEALVAELELPGADVLRLLGQLQDTVVPLIYVLRGLEEPNLARTA